MKSTDRSLAVTAAGDYVAKHWPQIPEEERWNVEHEPIRDVIIALVWGDSGDVNFKIYPFRVSPKYYTTTYHEVVERLRTHALGTPWEFLAEDVKGCEFYQKELFKLPDDPQYIPVTPGGLGGSPYGGDFHAQLWKTTAFTHRDDHNNVLWLNSLIEIYLGPHFSPGGFGCAGLDLGAPLPESLPTLRKRQQDESLADITRKQWEERRFTDAQVVIDKEVLMVHRSVLCAKSRVFASLFESGCCEGSSAQLDMTAEDPGAVRALIQYAYVGELPSDVDPVLLLPLADRYELFDCVSECADAIITRANERPAASLRALRPHADDPRLRPAWERLCDRLHRERALCLEVFRTL